MIDIHNHILPELDDGSIDLEHSIHMARQAVEQGIRIVIATPHHQNGRYSNEAALIEQQVNLLQEGLDQREIPLHIYSGQEVRVYNNLIEDIELKKICTLNNSRYLLLEFPSNRIPSGIHELLYELQLMNLRPIIAHPERNREIADNPLKLLELVQLGALSQVTAHSIIGVFGKQIQALSIQLCKHHLAHFIASDAHNNHNRAFKLAVAYQQLQEKVGQDIVNSFQNHANSIIHDLPIENQSPVWTKPKWFQFWK
ncbi:tyrosine-protein phosphatase [Paenibacillus hexagrammi]|uniref:Tyrosine-protein phosphatase n=1 Tax=Paenibacillus hexagrammi TaxID=2908839 RepID=A0ABY3SNK4_9BACL|nr:CpsB/CapC family capsule biosynthesis tyrosine phosphatase [Paenibacillus sp. YPD9-1]UJF34572.1 tyrosine protein phosphatase [Paenibacillus sp. YPD9-1]